MLAFIIVAAVMLMLFINDFRTLLKGGQARAAVAYGILTAAALFVIALYCFEVNLPGLHTLRVVHSLI